ncbi:MAG: hypothetical protein IJW98_05105 [Clostridia bacterium]|nr:hypothetical protein [Clostridia bacterium]
MKLYKERSWQLRTTGIDGNVILFGVNIFDYEWKSTGEHVAVKRECGWEDHADVYTADIDGKTRRFAAIEVSNCVWSFYLYQ